MRELLEDLFKEFRTGDIYTLSDTLIGKINSLVGLWHPLGFVIVKLFKSERYEYRLHVWPRGRRMPKSPDWPIHNHIFDLESLVLRGKIGSERIRVEDSALETCAHELYQVEYSQNGSDIIRTGRMVNVFTEGTSWANAGETYSIQKGDFHQSRVEITDFSASLVRISSLSSCDQPLVVGLPNKSPSYACPSIPVEKEELIGLIKELKY